MSAKGVSKISTLILIPFQRTVIFGFVTKTKYMKKLLVIAVIVSVLACNNSSNSTTGPDSGKTKTAQDSGMNMMMNNDSNQLTGDSSRK